MSPSADEEPGLPEQTLFQTDWWLDAVAGEQWTKLEIGDPLGPKVWLPIYGYKRLGLSMIGMPPLTPVLGPVVTLGLCGAHRRERVRGLIAEIPPYCRFRQVFSTNTDDAYVFALNGFSISNQFTDRLDPAESDSEAWGRLSGKIKNIIRKGKNQFSVDRHLDRSEFYLFLDENMTRLGRRNKVSQPIFMRAAAAAQDHDAIACLGARTRNGRLAAAIVVVWDSRRLYYLLSTRNPMLAANTATTLLIWEAILIANQKRLIFDFEGYGTSGAAAFIASFGGRPEARCVVTGSSRLGAVLTSTQDLWRAAWPNHLP